MISSLCSTQFYRQTRDPPSRRFSSLGLVFDFAFCFSGITSRVGVSEKSAASHAIIHCSAVENAWGILEAYRLATDSGAVKGDMHHCDAHPWLFCGCQKKRESDLDRGMPDYRCTVERRVGAIFPLWFTQADFYGPPPPAVGRCCLCRDPCESVGQTTIDSAQK